MIKINLSVLIKTVSCESRKAARVLRDARVFREGESSLIRTRDGKKPTRTNTLKKQVFFPEY